MSWFELSFVRFFVHWRDEKGLIVLFSVFLAVSYCLNHLMKRITHWTLHPDPPSWILLTLPWSAVDITSCMLYLSVMSFSFKMADSKDRKILFVCLGNICRSPSAEAILKHLLEKRGNSADWEIDSAGILDLHRGLRSDSRGLKVLKKHGISNPHRAR